MVCKYYDLAGVNRVALRAAWMLERLGHFVEIIFLRGPESVHRDLPGEFEGPISVFAGGRIASLSRIVNLPFVRLLYTDGFPDSSAPAPLIWAIAPLLGKWREKFDLVIFSDELLGIACIGSIRLADLTYGLIIHEGTFFHSQFLKSAQLDLYRSAKWRLSPSPVAAEMIKRATGIPVDFVGLARPSPTYELTKERFALVDTRWSPARDPGFLVDVLTKVEGPQVIMAGSFPRPALKARFLSRLESAGLASRVTVRTDLPELEVARLYSRALCYMRWSGYSATSVPETGLGWGFIRAIENGCPIIADDGLGASRLISDGKEGMVVDRNPASFALALKHLWTNEGEAKSMANAAWNLAVRLSAGIQFDNLANRLSSKPES